MLSSFGSFLEMYDMKDKPCAAVKIGKTQSLDDTTTVSFDTHKSRAVHADPEVSIAVVPSRKTLWNFSIRFWIIIISTEKHIFLIFTHFVHQNNLHR